MLLDDEIIAQLKEAFSALQGQVELRMDHSPHEDQFALEQMLQGFTKASAKIKVSKSDKNVLVPQFQVFRNQLPTGISFRGIPGGHEFTSLVLAILNTDGLGKMPDAVIQDRIKALKGPVRVKTYISLSCENCPDVVQALNQMSLIHKDFHHEMVDGSYAQEEVSSLNIQGVPTVVLDNQSIHSGRINLIDLLGKLEAEVGLDATATSSSPKDLGLFDVVVVGGGPAGASAAIYSARKGLKTAIIAEKFGGQVQETKGIENFISVPYLEGPQLAGQLSVHMDQYNIQKLEHRRLNKFEGGKPNRLELNTGEFLTAKQVIIATGAKWRELGVPGEKEYLGRGVAFCPHCDGPFYKGKKVAVIGGGNSGVEAAIDLAGIVKEVVLFEFAETLKADEVLQKKLKSLPNVSVITQAKTKQVLGTGERVSVLEYEDMREKQIKKESLDGIFVQIGLLPNSHVFKDKIKLTPFGEIIVDEKGRTSLPNVYAAGDVTTTPYKQIIIAMGEGAKVALAAFEDTMKGANA